MGIQNSAEVLSKDFRVFLFISDGHDELGTDFVSMKERRQAVSYLHRNGIRYLDMVYGISMGVFMYMLAHHLMPVKRLSSMPHNTLSLSEVAVPNNSFKRFLMLKTAFRSLKL